MPTEGAVGLGFEEFKALLADCMVHVADNQGFVGISVEFLEADVAFVYCPLEFLGEGVHSFIMIFVSGLFIQKVTKNGCLLKSFDF